MNIQIFLFCLVLSNVLGDTLFHQPAAKEASKKFGKRAHLENLIQETTTSGVTAPRSFDGPTVSGFNFDQFAADDFINDEIWAIDRIDIKVAVNNLDSYDINRVFIAIYPDEGRGMPDYDPYDRLNPAPQWYQWYDWYSDDPEFDYPEPYLDNPVRAGAVIVNTTDEIFLNPGHWWITLHFEILNSDVSVPSASWLPGDTDLYLHRPARLYIPGNNPSSGSVNAFGWFWNDLENFGIGALAFTLLGRSTSFLMEVGEFPIRCPGQSRIETMASVSFPQGDDFDVTLELEIDGDGEIFSDLMILNASNPMTNIYIRHLVAGNNYNVEMRFVAPTGLVWTESQVVRAVSDMLFAPQIVVRDEYGLVGGFFQWQETSRPEFYEIEMIPDGGNFSDPQLHAYAEGTFYRPKLSDWVEGGDVNNFEPRDQAIYQMRIRAANPSCPSHTPSEWATLTFESDSCEVFSASFPQGTYNFQKGRFVSSVHSIRDYGSITDVRVKVNGFHQKWTSAAIAVATPVNYLGTTIDIPQFSDGCEEDFDSGDFEIRFSLDESKLVEDICPPPQEGSTYQETLIDPIGGVILEDFVRGQEKRGNWAVEWLDRGIGFPTNGKIESYDLVICSVPALPREHIVNRGESKIRRGTIGVYGS